MIWLAIILWVLGVLQSYSLAGNTFLMSIFWPFTLIAIFILSLTNWYFEK